MRQNSLLISKKLLNDFEFLKDMSGTDLRELLHFLLKDPDLWKKIALLKSEKYTKTYQKKGQDLFMFKFYPFPEDWCELSALSNGSGFSRCYIFVFLLKFYLGIYKLEKFINHESFEVTILKNSGQDYIEPIFCRVKVDRNKHNLRRILKPRKNQTKIKLLINQIPLRYR